MDFQNFPKIARFSREVTITEKIDGTNSQVFIVPKKDDGGLEINLEYAIAINEELGLVMYAGSRNRYLTPDKDNFGFATWVKANSEELFQLGPDHHYGEWWGKGIQRNYNQSEKHWSLFNVKRFLKDFDNEQPICPNCCRVVPILWRGNFDDLNINQVMFNLSINGSSATPGFMKPEGVVIYHSAAGVMFKKTFENDLYGKGDN